jgi:hypothetical protein
MQSGRKTFSLLFFISGMPTLRTALRLGSNVYHIHNMLFAFEINNSEWMKPSVVVVTTGNSMKHIRS